MRPQLFILSFLLLTFQTLAYDPMISGYPNREDLKTLPVVDLNRYMGRWYEIIRLPFIFESKCHCVTADYSLNLDGTIKVVNQCNENSPQGKLEVATGVGSSNGGSNTKWTVEFFWPFSSQYWIIDVDPEYRWAMVGHPSRRGLWILSREPSLDNEIVVRLLDEAVKLDFSVHSVIHTYQGQLCEYSDSMKKLEK